MRCPQSGHLKRAAFVPEMLIPHDTHLRVPRCWLSLIPGVSPGRHLTLLKHRVTRRCGLPTRLAGVAEPDRPKVIRDRTIGLRIVSDRSRPVEQVTAVVTRTRQRCAELFDREVREVWSENRLDATDEPYAPEATASMLAQLGVDLPLQG